MAKRCNMHKYCAEIGLWDRALLALSDKESEGYVVSYPELGLRGDSHAVRVSSSGSYDPEALVFKHTMKLVSVSDGYSRTEVESDDTRRIDVVRTPVYKQVLREVYEKAPLTAEEKELLSSVVAAFLECKERSIQTLTAEAGKVWMENEATFMETGYYSELRGEAEELGITTRERTVASNRDSVDVPRVEVPMTQEFKAPEVVEDKVFSMNDLLAKFGK